MKQYIINNILQLELNKDSGICCSLCERVQSSIEELYTLEDNFDGYGSPKITEIAIQKARKICENFIPQNQPEIVASFQGGVRLFFRDNIECRVSSDGSIEITER